MILTITVLGYPKQLSFPMDPTVPLNIYSWLDIVSGNIICLPELHIKILHLKHEGVELDITKSAQELNLSENSLITVYINTFSSQDFYGSIQTSHIHSEEEPTEFSVSEPIPEEEPEILPYTS